MTMEEFLAWEHTGIAELVDGEVFQMLVKYEHQSIVDFLNALLRSFVSVFKLGIICSAPYSMSLSPQSSAREPDLMFIATANLQRITSNVLDGPADLIIEVVSDESVARDYDDKFKEYQAGGVLEYWIIDSRAERNRVSFFVLDAQGKYRPVPLDDNGIYRSSVLAPFWIKADWLWQIPSPAIEDLLLDIGGDEYAQHMIARLRQRGKLP